MVQVREGASLRVLALPSHHSPSSLLRPHLPTQVCAAWAHLRLAAAIPRLSGALAFPFNAPHPPSALEDGGGEGRLVTSPGAAFGGVAATPATRLRPAVAADSATDDGWTGDLSTASPLATPTATALVVGGSGSPLRAPAPSPLRPRRPAAASHAPLFLEVSVSGGGAGAGEGADRGVYLRDPAQSDRACDAAVTLRPVWPSAAPNDGRVAYQAPLRLLPSDPRWLAAPAHVLVAGAGRSLSLHVDPRSLAPGAAHFGELAAFAILPEAAAAAVAAAAGLGAAGSGSGSAAAKAGLTSDDEAADAVATAAATLHALTAALSRPRLDALHATAARLGDGSVGSGAWLLSAALGPVARVPVTAIRPVAPTATADACVFVAAPPSGSPVLRLGAGGLHRSFIAVPLGASWAEVTVTRFSGPPGGGDATPRTIIVHAMQTVRHASPSDTHAEQAFALGPGAGNTLAMPVVGGHTLEVVAAQARGMGEGRRRAMPLDPGPAPTTLASPPKRLLHFPRSSGPPWARLRSQCPSPSAARSSARARGRRASAATPAACVRRRSTSLAAWATRRSLLRCAQRRRPVCLRLSHVHASCRPCSTTRRCGP